jgi:hypothetical protein
MERGDIKKAVEMALREWPEKWNDQTLSVKCGVSDRFVWEIRKKLTPTNVPRC